MKIGFDEIELSTREKLNNFERWFILIGLSANAGWFSAMTIDSFLIYIQ